MTIEVLLFPLVLLIVYYGVHGGPDFVDALVDHFEATFVDSVLVLLLLHSHVEIAVFSRAINHACLAVKESTLFSDSCASVYPD